MKFKINDKYSIEAFDNKNWVIRYKRTSKAKKPATTHKNADTGVFGYYSTLGDAKQDMAELLAKKAKDFTELNKWIDTLKKV